MNLQNALRALAATGLSLLVSASFVSASQSKLDQIVATAYKAKGPETMRSAMTMSLIDAAGKQSDRRLQIRREGDSKQLVWFDAPANMRGTGFLRVAENGNEKMWLYLPAFKKLERIGAADKKRPFLGSDFTYADMAPLDLNQYNATLLGQDSYDGKPVYKLAFGLKSATYDTLYGKIVAYVDVDANRVLAEDLYDKTGDLIKKKTYSGYSTAGKYHIPTIIEITNVRRNHRTRLTLTDIVVNKKIAKRLFTTKYLQRQKK